MIRKITLGVLIGAAAFLGMALQVGTWMLGFTTPTVANATAGDVAGAFAVPGAHAVGVRRARMPEAPMDLSLWYPAAESEADGPRSTYPYGMSMLGPETSVALATYRGAAIPESTPDLPAEPYPLVILSHGFAIGETSYAWLAEHLASHGMVVLAPTHPESLDPGVLWRSTVTRPDDIRSVLEYVDGEIESGRTFDGLVDTESVAVIGHSYGGYTALAAAGARIDGAAFASACETTYRTEGRLTFLCDALLPRWSDMAALAGVEPETALWPAWGDPRVDAVVSMAGDSAMFGERGLSEITVPVMAIGGTADVDSPFEWGTELTYEHVSSERKVEVGLEGAQHMIFAGGCESTRRILNLVSLGFCSDPGWDRGAARDLVRHYTTAFLLAELTSDADAGAALASGAGQGWTHRATGY